MSTSGVTIYQLTRNQLIEAAISKLGVLARGQTPDTEDYTKGALSLNALVAYLRAKGLPLWSRQEYTLTLSADVSSYTFGDGEEVDTAYPLKMLEAYSVPVSGTSRIPVEIISNSNYNMLPTGSTGGQPIKLTYQPKVNKGVVKVWPTPSSDVVTAYTLLLVYQEPFSYFTSASHTMDFPEEWYLPIIYKLATLLAPEWGIPLEDRRELKSEAKEYLDLIDSYGSEDASFFFQADRR